MGAALLDEGDARRAAPAEGIADTGDELETRRAATYDPDMMETGFRFSTESGTGAFVGTSSRMDLSSGVRRSQRCRCYSTQIDAPESFAGFTNPETQKSSHESANISFSKSLPGRRSTLAMASEASWVGAGDPLSGAVIRPRSRPARRGQRRI
jgi:hypothetical protein